MSDVEQLKQACQGVSCVVSALAGLHETIVDSQIKLLDAAISAGVPRFIPSDYSSDFTKLPAGENRNFDLRKEFHLNKSDRLIQREKKNCIPVGRASNIYIVCLASKISHLITITYGRLRQRYPDVRWTSAIDVISKIG
jgi:NmrA-like family